MIVTSLVPVIYIYFGSKLPSYLRVNVELASRQNFVVVLANSAVVANNPQYCATKYSNCSVSYEDVNSYFAGASKFARSYKHLVR